VTTRDERSRLEGHQVKIDELVAHPGFDRRGVWLLMQSDPAQIARALVKLGK
jgi:hypothetical protein